jgi:HlyD family secretion protein
MTAKRKFLLIGAGVVVVGGFTALSVAKRRQPSVEVRLEKVQKRDLVSIVTASGRIQPKRKVDVSSDITGRIVSLPVREGDLVERNQVLVRIDPTQYEASVQSRQAFLASSQAQASQARATRDQAERAFVRARDIRAQNPQLVSQEALEQAETQQRISVAKRGRKPSRCCRTQVPPSERSGSAAHSSAYSISCRTSPGSTQCRTVPRHPSRWDG